MNGNAGDKSAADSLREAIELLAMPGSDGLTRRGCAEPDQLAIDFDEAYTAFVGQLVKLPSPAQLEALQELDQQLDTMSDPALRPKWTADAMKSDPDWQVVRSLAGAALAAFGWSGAAPEPS